MASKKKTSAAKPDHTALSMALAPAGSTTPVEDGMAHAGEALLDKEAAGTKVLEDADNVKPAAQDTAAAAAPVATVQSAKASPPNYDDTRTWPTLTNENLCKAIWSSRGKLFVAIEGFPEKTISIEKASATNYLKDNGADASKFDLVKRENAIFDLIPRAAS